MRAYPKTTALLLVLTLVAFGMVAFANIGHAADVQVRLTWDPNDPTPEGYRVFQRAEGGSYDYSAPAWEGPGVLASITYPGPDTPVPLAAVLATPVWDVDSSSISLSWTQEVAVNEKTDYWIVRAYDGELESADSEEVFWKSTAENKTADWKVYYSLTSGTDYVLLDTVQGSAGILQTTKPLTVVAPGETKMVYFAIVTFGEDGQFSPNSAEVAVEVSRPGPPEVPTGVKVEVVVPVQ